MGAMPVELTFAVDTSRSVLPLQPKVLALSTSRAGAPVAQLIRIVISMTMDCSGLESDLSSIDCTLVLADCGSPAFETRSSRLENRKGPAPAKTNCEV